MRLILCEKPSQAKDISNAIKEGKVERGEGYFSFSDTVITWGYGHLMSLYEPEHYNPEWKRWSFEHLPLSPPVYKYEPKKDTAKHFKMIVSLIKKADSVIIATDADREGEMIAREILEFAGYKKSIKRLWLSALDEESIKKGFQNLKEGRETENLFYSARGRSIADWIIGINLTRGLTLRKGIEKEVLNIGRVQTPTFSLVVRRDREIANFKSRIFYSLDADIRAGDNNVLLSYNPKEEKIFEKEEALAIQAEITGQEGTVSVEENHRKKSAPPLFSLSLLQKEMNKKYGWSADQTLDKLQELYEKDKLTTYPRSDCNYLPEEQRKDIPQLIENYLYAFPMQKEILPAAEKLIDGGKANYNTSKITAHHAIIPTLVKADISKLSNDKALLYEVISDRFICSLFPDFEYLEKVISFTGRAKGNDYLFSSKGITPLNNGWKDFIKSEKEENEGKELPNIKDKSQGEVLSIDLKEGKTSSPKPYTEGTLIADMERIGKFVEDETYKKILKETAGLGTEATRAGIIANLKKNGFLEVKKRNILSTEKSNRLYDVLHESLPDLIAPEKTAVWEEELELISTGERKEIDFIKEIEKQAALYVHTVGTLEMSEDKKKREVNPTGINSFHPDHLNEEIMQDVKKWVIPGYGNVQKNIAGRVFSLEEIKAILSGEKTGPMEFKGKKGTFKASLVYKGQNKKYNSPDFEFLTENKEEKNAVLETSLGSIYDNGDSYSIGDIKGRIFKSAYGKNLSPEDVKNIVESGENGFEFKDLISKKNKPYSAFLFFDTTGKWARVNIKFN